MIDPSRSRAGQNRKWWAPLKASSLQRLSPEARTPIPKLPGGLNVTGPVGVGTSFWFSPPATTVGSGQVHPGKAYSSCQVLGVGLVPWEYHRVLPVVPDVR